METLRKLSLGFVGFMLVATISCLFVGKDANAVIFTVLAIPSALSYWVACSFAPIEEEQKWLIQPDDDEIFDWADE